MTLHEAMVEILLRQGGGWLARDEIARVIATEGLYTRRDGRPPESDQLRLRARKYPYVFDCSDTGCTRIRLCPGETSAEPAARPAPARRPRLGGAPGRQPDDKEAIAARRRRTRAAKKHRPERIRLLLVAEAPPSALDRYFYFEDVADHDSLFRYVARAILKVEPSRTNKADLMRRLCEKGVFLIDLKLEPVDGTPVVEALPGLLRRVRDLAPEKIILIKASVYDAAYRALAEGGQPVVDERVPFPGSGQQRKFEVAFARALKKRPRSRSAPT